MRGDHSRAVGFDVRGCVRTGLSSRDPQARVFFNARIVGSTIYARARELLIAMLVSEVAFGISGLVIAPIYYGYLKRELTDRNLV